MLKLCEDGYYRVPEWMTYPWLQHGFGTKEQAPPSTKIATVQQTHSNDVVIAVHSGPQGTGDALISSALDVQVSVRTADCLPILLVDPVVRVVAAVHAGWRGTAKNIVGQTLEKMEREFGSRLLNVEAAIGPGIGVCCFEVGAEVAREFGAYDTDEKTHLDLPKINRGLLTDLRVIYDSGLCTVCDQQFWSFRREREQAGRMHSYIGQTTER